jgi:hypothetical protein
MVLQLKTGVLDARYFRGKFAVEIWNEFQPVFNRLSEERLLYRDDDTIALTRRGLLRVDHFLPEFFETDVQTV